MAYHDNINNPQAPFTASRSVFPWELKKRRKKGVIPDQQFFLFEERSARNNLLINTLLSENPAFADILRVATSESELHSAVFFWLKKLIANEPAAFRKQLILNRHICDLNWRECAAARIFDYLRNSGRKVHDPNYNQTIVIRPFGLLREAATHDMTAVDMYFLIDMIHLFRQLTGRQKFQKPGRKKLRRWMERFTDGLNPEIIELREQNKQRIIKKIARKIEQADSASSAYTFPPGCSDNQKLSLIEKWWEESRFHLVFSVRDPETLNDYLDNTLSKATFRLMKEAGKKGIPFFINPYYLSLLLVDKNSIAAKLDKTIRDYIFYSRELIDEFGYIRAWEKEDTIEEGKPNAAGWILPYNIGMHRRYPEVAIIIPETRGRACAGLCVSCQRMYDFQRGHLNFNLNELAPRLQWQERLACQMDYFRYDSQLRDILITGGDALMSTDNSLEMILQSLLQVIIAKCADNLSRPIGEKYNEIQRVRLGTRLPVYLPQRITPQLAQILSDFRTAALQHGVKQFFVQTHFVSPLEITPEARNAVALLLNAGWTVVNQAVFTTAASRRGHTAKLRKCLNDIGVLPYYTFSVKGFRENTHNFATNSRLLQEQEEERILGRLPLNADLELSATDNTHVKTRIDAIESARHQYSLPFIATDRSVMNLPALGKSLTFRVIGLSPDGRRILDFEHDLSRKHSPMLHKLGKITIIESKPIGVYLEQIKQMRENVFDYQSIYGYSCGQTTPRNPIYDYPPQPHQTTTELTNFFMD